MDFDNNIPIYQQIVDRFKQKIISRQLNSGDRINSVRDLAIEMGVNPNTMQKALAVLEQERIVFSERTSGRYVTKDTEIIKELKHVMLKKEIERFLSAMESMGYKGNDVLQVLLQYQNGNKNRGNEN